jgi:hypothetical protein
MAQIFDTEQTRKIDNGKAMHLLLTSSIDEALNHNPFGENYCISSPPGMAKTHETKLALSKLKNTDERLLFEGAASMAGFIIEFTTAVYLHELSGSKKKLPVVLDDCDVLFEPKNANTTKKMFDQTKALKYTKMAKQIKPMCTDLQWEAIEHYSSPEKVGFSVPTDNVTFLIITNRHLHTHSQVERLQEGELAHTKATELYAIRRRVQYEEINMKKDDLWGYIANVVWNHSICETFMPNITQSQKLEILEWCEKKWNKVTERNLSLVEKMTKDMVRFPSNYKDVWANRYLEL